MTTTASRTFTPAELFSYVWNYLDGAGICCTDADLLAEEIADSFNCQPTDVYLEYEGTDEGTDDNSDSEPEDGDYITTDYRAFHVHNGRTRFVIPEGANWQDAIREHMDAQQFWPNVWLQRERGGFNLLDTSTGEFAK